MQSFAVTYHISLLHLSNKVQHLTTYNITISFKYLNLTKYKYFLYSFKGNV